MKKRSVTVFSISFIDCITCGLGAMLLLFVIVNARSVASRSEVTSDLGGEVDRIEKEVLEGKKQLVEARNTLEQIVEELVKTEGLSRRVIQTLTEKKTEIASYENDTLASREHINRLKADLKSKEGALKRDLRAMHRLLVENRDALVEAVHRDYGNRSRFETLFAECFLNQEGILDAIKHLRKWMRPQKRRLDITQYPLARARVIPQPLGVVGVVVPWNFPISMAFAPLTGIVAAGNRAMVKMSENSNHLARLLMEISPKYLPHDKLRFFEDGGGRGPAFTTLPYDHIFFTGSPQTGKAVMANAARNLTPVTLELGGKSPAVVAPDYPIETAVERIMWVKLLNAGQICTNVDYLFLPEGRVDDFVRLARKVVSERYPDINGNDYTSIIDERAYRRLETTLEDARRKSARLVNLVEGQVISISLLVAERSI